MQRDGGMLKIMKGMEFFAAEPLPDGYDRMIPGVGLVLSAVGPPPATQAPAAGSNPRAPEGGGSKRRRPRTKVALRPVPCPRERGIKGITATRMKELECTRGLVEYCCVPDSLLSRAWPEGEGCLCTRITEAEDALSDEGHLRAVEAVSAPPTLLWASMECVGGCPWRR